MKITIYLAPDALRLACTFVARHTHLAGSIHLHVQPLFPGFPHDAESNAILLISPELEALLENGGLKAGIQEAIDKTTKERNDTFRDDAAFSTESPPSDHFKDSGTDLRSHPSLTTSPSCSSLGSVDSCLCAPVRAACVFVDAASAASPLLNSFAESLRENGAEIVSRNDDDADDDDDAIAAKSLANVTCRMIADFRSCDNATKTTDANNGAASRAHLGGASATDRTTAAATTAARKTECQGKRTKSCPRRETAGGEGALRRGSDRRHTVKHRRRLNPVSKLFRVVHGQIRIMTADGSSPPTTDNEDEERLTADLDPNIEDRVQLLVDDAHAGKRVSNDSGHPSTARLSADYAEEQEEEEEGEKPVPKPRPLFPAKRHEVGP